MFPAYGMYSFRPIVKFKAQNGNIYQFIDLCSENEDSFLIGQIVNVIYTKKTRMELDIHIFENNSIT